jgi:hypothetical protein
MKDEKKAAEVLLHWAQRGDEYRTQRLLRWAGGLIAAGLLVQLVTLYWNHPIAFLVFIGLGVSLVAAGILVFMLFLMRRTEPGES